MDIRNLDRALRRRLERKSKETSEMIEKSPEMKKLLLEIKEEMGLTIKDEKALKEYSENLPENQELIEDIGNFKEIDFGSIPMKGIKIVKIKDNTDNKSLIKILNKVEDNQNIDKLNVPELKEIATIDDDGKIILDEKMEKALKIYNPEFIRKIKEETIVVKEKEPGKLVLKDDREENDKIEKEKNEIAKSIGVKADDVMCVLVIRDNEVAGNIFGKKEKSGTVSTIVRLKNGTFRFGELGNDGKFIEQKGMEVHNVSKEIFYNFSNNSTSYAVAGIGSMKTGRTNERIGPSDDVIEIKGKGDTGEANGMILVNGMTNNVQAYTYDRDESGIKVKEDVHLEREFPGSRVIMANGEKENVYENDMINKEHQSNDYNIEDNSVNELRMQVLRDKILELDSKIDELTEKLNDYNSREDNDVSKRDLQDEIMDLQGEMSITIDGLNNLLGENEKIDKANELVEHDVIHENEKTHEPPTEHTHNTNNNSN